MRFAGFLLAALLCAVAAVPASADIDQLCLKQCVANGGGTATTCLTQCSYGDTTPQAAKAKPVAPPLTHRPLHTPMPVAQDALLGKKPLTASPPEKDYACFQDCLRSGQAYGMCETHCTKVECPAGTVLCQNKPKMFEASQPQAR